MIIPNYIKNIIDAVEEKGFSIYLVGGCVRDYLLGKPCNDFDLTTSASPLEMHEVLKGFKLVDTGIKHGTVSVICEEGTAEITTFRSDGAYIDNRHPETVTFSSSIEEDLKRRDFTINAMAYSHKTGLIDLFGGKQDLEKGVIRCVGDAETRFEEDSLRILRCLRFASKLGFDIEEKTSLALKNKKSLLSSLSSERILKELEGILVGDFAPQIILKYKEIFFQIIPELEPLDGFLQNSPYHIYDIFLHTVVSLWYIPKDKTLRLAMLLHDIGKQKCYTEDEKGHGHFYNHGKLSADISKEILTRLKVPNKEKELILKLICHHSDQLTDEKSCIKRFLNIFGEDDFNKFLHIRYADCMAKAPETTKSNLEYLSKIVKVYRDIIKENECYNLKMLSVSGNDVKKLRFEKDKIGKALELVLNAVIDEKTENNKDCLLNYIKLNKNVL